MKEKKENYVDPIQFKQLIVAYKETGVIDEQLGTYLMKMVAGIGHRFKATEDQQSDCIIKALKALSYLDCRRKPSWLFNYITSVIFNQYRRLYVFKYRDKARFEKYVLDTFGRDFNDCQYNPKEGNIDM